MKLAASLKPEYFYQPKVALRRLFSQTPKTEFANYQLPWGMQIQVRTLDEQGRIILTLGIIDLAVSEALWRLAKPGELVVDAGANIGYMTAVLANRVSKSAGGRVVAIEAHPEIFAELENNVKSWHEQKNLEFDIRNIALSKQQGKVQLQIPDSFSSNRGLASVAVVDSTSSQKLVVDSYSLDDLFSSESDEIGVLKLDVEGHEIQVLQGAENLIKRKRIRDCVFEEHREYPTDVTDYFEAMGYSVFRIHKTFFKPKLLLPDSKVARTNWLPTSFLATHQPQRAIQIFREYGWKILNKNY